jgi:ATP-binding cassette subfamily B protein
MDTFAKSPSCDDLKACLWEWKDLSRALKEMGRRLSLLVRPVASFVDEGFDEKTDSIDRWIELNAEYLGVEVEEKDASFENLEAVLGSITTGLIEITVQGRHGFLTLLNGRGKVLQFLGRDGTVHKMAIEQILELLLKATGSSFFSEVDGILDAAKIPVGRRCLRVNAFFKGCAAPVHIHGIWEVRLPAGATFWRQMGNLKLPRRLCAFLSLYLLKYILWLGGWWLIGQSALDGRMDRAWVVAWLLLQLTLIPLDLLSNWMLGIFTLSISALLKRRLLAGTLRLEPEEVRLDGTGQHLSRIMESEALESNLLSGAFLALLGIIDLLFAGIVLSQGANGIILTILLAVWMTVCLIVLWSRYKVHRKLTDHRVVMGHDLVDKIVGHRTRLAQEITPGRHLEEDEQLEHYLGLSRQYDRSATRCSVLIPGGWTLLSLAGLAVGLTHNTSYSLAVSLGGILLGTQALNKLASGFGDLASAWVAWGRIAPIFKAAGRPGMAVSPAAMTASSAKQATPLIEAHELTFQYGNRAQKAIDKCDLKICPGDRILLEGPSGGGKSTLASLLGGLRSPTDGLLLSQGLDRQTIGTSGWHQRVAVAPQFHENYVFNDTMAFNLLTARGWPPRDQDLEEAEELCRQLGLGALLDQMPAGLSEMLGESGWQLSHGERSRLFIARALLQGAELVVIDEALASLDPPILHSTVQVMSNWAQSILVIAHP